MADNIVRLLEDRLRERPMKTMDPNTQRAGDEALQSPRSLYHRGIMAAALASLLEYSRKDKHIKSLLPDQKNREYASIIFNGQFDQLTDKLKTYSGYNPDNAGEDFNFVFQQLIEIVSRIAGADPMAAKDYLSGQRANILAYLPGELQTGKFLNNTTIDDNTNKMHGPFSDFTHWMEQLFSTSDQ